MRETDKKTLAKLYEGRRSSKGIEIVRMLNNLANSYRILNENFKELSAAQELYMKDWSIVKPENSQKLRQFLMRFLRLLHNYLASFGSFVEHTRVFIKHLKNPQLKRSYELTKKRLQIAEKTQFVKDLRNYSYHYQLPMVGAPLDYIMTPEGMVSGTVAGITKSEISLNKEDLMKYNRWTSVSKQFLQKYGKEIPIIGLFGNPGFLHICQASTKELHNLLCDQVKDLYRAEIKDSSEIQLKIQRLELKVRMRQARKLKESLEKKVKF